MRRLITYSNALLLGMILGMIFVAIFHARPSHRQQEVRAHRIPFAYEIFVARNQTTLVLVAGQDMRLISLPVEFCPHFVHRSCHTAASIISSSNQLDSRTQIQPLRK